ncbi:CaaX farnesyltransferase alpha subunit Ram2 [Talaromyces stipitatus ATCC 10500]|uniref:Protein farnesyltransferase/geranylgeranyltransferase type-1 subunit alpha n=1 Tax=Talaromyces stipitatus (strain ATCC 10500 / CBS 375.48 / QM 6759 / NRRL 1006) TaxID=441959 RepID=B8MK74_TALSN|nr:CaaX farnesyltransferase alpha subunit Ram2 [Talaromyces stipitatus ATCC 10500]EED15229.1 CaaX farnesyltransferase alpha subunit Ram2 [Talaromyces stipitatus ATCC 10500]
MEQGKYNTSPDWTDINPIPLDDGSQEEEGITSLAAIAYKPEYLEATSYLRAVMAANEMSERVLQLTEDVIMMNPAHYTVWLYRAKILFALKKDLTQELVWLNKVSLKYLKNYQIWHHRQQLLSSKEHFPTLPEGEQDFLMQMFDADSKNYHVWSYRQWLVRQFNLWDDPREMSDVELLISEDVRNNSAWNHRYLLRFAPRQGAEAAMSVASDASEKGCLNVVDEDVVDAELEYAQKKILRAPENRSPWLYARGVLRAAGRSLAEWKGFASRFFTEEISDAATPIVHVKSSLALEWLADVFCQEAREQQQKEKVDEAVKMLTLLKERYDPIRKNYWDYKIGQLSVSV